MTLLFHTKKAPKGTILTCRNSTLVIYLSQIQVFPTFPSFPCFRSGSVAQYENTETLEILKTLIFQ